MKLQVVSALLVVLMAVQTNAQGDTMLNMLLMRALSGGGGGGGMNQATSYGGGGATETGAGSGGRGSGASSGGYGSSGSGGGGSMFGGGFGSMMAMSGGMGDFMRDTYLCRMMGGQARMMCMMRAMN